MTKTKRQFVMLAHTFEEEKNINVCGWYMSRKLDGLRVVWDGGISRGIPVKEVPYANIEKDVNKDYLATGLWSRNAKVIRAPSWFLDALPRIPLDGEIYSGNKNWELTASIVKDHVPNERDWRKISIHAFDSPPMDVLFQEGIVDTEHYYKVFTKGVLDWAIDRAKKLDVVTELNYRQFEFVYGYLNRLNVWNEQLKVLQQERLPYSTDECLEIINQRMEEVIDDNGEGLMLRKPESLWSPERHNHLLKVKKWYDAEATIKWLVWGRKTNKGSRLLGRMGTMAVEWEGKLFEVSGFNDTERSICFPDGNSAIDIGRLNSGKRVPENLVNPKFNIGEKITFRYRELTALGIPKNPQYVRKAIDT
jgi:DNA ligase 1